jgi:plasmid stability protein
MPEQPGTFAVKMAMTAGTQCRSVDTRRTNGYHNDITLGEGGSMAQIVVRRIPDADFETFRERAQRLGRSTEEEVRRLIVETAEAERQWQQFELGADRLRERIRRRTGTGTDSTALIRRMRRSR